MDSHRRNLVAHLLPMFLFLALLAMGQFLHGGQNFILRHSEFWIFPLQTILCGAVLFWFRRCYELAQPRNIVLTLLLATIVFVLWISPQQFFGFGRRLGGFDPDLLPDRTPFYWFEIALRFLRLVIVVPLIEEIFWRSFLLRFLIQENFERVPFGKFGWVSFAIVTLMFCFSHSRLDWPAALFAGALYNLGAYRTRSLSSCVLAHATTNLLLGIWIMTTGQWGFW